MKRWSVLTAWFILFGATACSRPDPAAQCATTDARKGYLDAIFSAVSDAKERDETSIVGEQAVQSAREMIGSLRKSNPVNIGAITAERYDAATGNIDCRIEITFRPSGDFATQSVRDQAHEMESARSTAIFPVGFFEGRSAPIDAIFQLRRDADAKMHVRGSNGFYDVTRLAYELLSAKSLSDRVLAANPGSDPSFKVVDLQTQPLPAVGQCSFTKVHDTGYRLEGVPDSGTAVTFEDGHSMVDYSTSPPVARWMRGDRINLCVVSVPTGCPANDHRGITYKAINMRTKRAWVAADSEHMCGGA